jgi:hypothetical protein
VDVDHAATCVAYLTSMTSGWNDDATEQLVYEFARLDDPDALADAVNKIARTWTSYGRVPLGVIIDAYQHEVRLREDAARELLTKRQAAIRCDGSGWWTVDGDELPCPTCSPALSRIWNDPDMKRRWRNGQPTHRILGYDDRDEYVKDLKRPTCVPDDPEPAIDQRRGMAVAVDAYRAEYGREPGRGMRAMIAAAGARRVTEWHPG